MATPKKLPSGSWRVRVWDKNLQKQISITCPTKKDCEIAAAAYISDKRKPPEKLTLGQACDRYIEMKKNVLSPSTIAGYDTIRRCNLGALENRLVGEITSQLAQKHINEISRNLSPKSVRNIWGFISAVLSDNVPHETYKVTLPQKQKRIVEFPEVDEILRRFRGTDVEIPVLCALWLGMRLSEIRGAKKSDIVDGVLTIRRTLLTVNGEYIERDKTKTYHSTRRIRVPKYLLQLIGESKGEYLTHLTGAAIYKQFEKGIAGLPRITFHDLRHLNASVMLSLGIPDKYAMERGGWSSPAVMKGTYQHTFSAARKKIDDQIDQFFSDQLGEE